MRYLFELPIGDPGGDGHEQVDYFTISSNVEFDEIQHIFKKMNAEYNLTSLFQDYEEDQLSDYQYETLIANLPEAAELFDTDLSLSSGTDGAAELFILAMKNFDPSLELEIVNTPILAEASFGYGLFD